MNTFESFFGTHLNRNLPEIINWYKIRSHHDKWTPHFLIIRTIQAGKGVTIQIPFISYDTMNYDDHGSLENGNKSSN